MTVHRNLHASRNSGTTNHESSMVSPEPQRAREIFTLATGNSKPLEKFGHCVVKGELTKERGP